MRGNSLISKVERFCNILELAGVILVLVMAFLFQVVLHELPCPLCLLQRVGLFGVALGFLMNLQFGLRPSHYAMILVSAMFMAMVALRQIALHVIPGTGSYGDPIFGFHLYTWSFIIAVSVITVTTIMLGVDRQYLCGQPRNIRYRRFKHVLFAVLATLIFINFVSVLLECGFGSCPSNPTHYLF